MMSFTISTNENMRPLKLWQSLVFFLGPGLFGLAARYYLFPGLVRAGLSLEMADNIFYLSVFTLLFFLVLIGLRAENRPLNLQTLRDRLRFRAMDSQTWKWTIGFLFLNLLLSLALNILAQFVYGKLNFWPPNADIPLTNIPILIVIFLLNIISEELWWRGYILPRQELEHGKYAWIVNGVLWALFHLSKWWAVPFMLLQTWMIPFLAQRTQNNTPAFIIHFISNGLGIMLLVVRML
jgi:membrane protease YdiL (CAAX protease family)